MTRSELSVYSPKVAKKAFKAQAKEAGVHIRSGLLPAPKDAKPVGITRRNPGRMDGVQWNGCSFICAVRVDDGTISSLMDVDDDAEDFEDHTHTKFEPPVISLLDIARPAKPKGVAKEFEVVDGVRRVIALEDVEESNERWEVGEDEDWEEVYAEIHFRERKSYSAALRGKEG